MLLTVVEIYFFSSLIVKCVFVREGKQFLCMCIIKFVLMLPQ